MVWSTQVNYFYLQILLATKVTLSISLLSFIFALIIGAILAIADAAPYPIKSLVNAASMLIRGLPEIVILFICYYGLTSLLTKWYGHYVNLNPFVSGVIILSLIMSTYVSKILIAAYKAIPKDEIDAALSLGLNSTSILLFITLP